MWLPWCIYTCEGFYNKFCTLSDCISKINNTHVDNAKDPDVVMSVHNLTEYSDNCSKASGNLWQYYTDEPDNNAITNFESFKSKVKIAWSTLADDNTEEDVAIAVPWKYLRNFWRALEMPQINCEINHIVTWSADCVISPKTGTITHIKLQVPVVISSTQDNAKLPQ